jgi:hypothetical protein
VHSEAIYDCVVALAMLSDGVIANS